MGVLHSFTKKCSLPFTSPSLIGRVVKEQSKGMFRAMERIFATVSLPAPDGPIIAIIFCFISFIL
nr:MAG TPA: hypothetical protein [Caudoviricetes sp.]